MQARMDARIQGRTTRIHNVSATSISGAGIKLQENFAKTLTMMTIMITMTTTTIITTTTANTTTTTTRTTSTTTTLTMTATMTTIMMLKRINRQLQWCGAFWTQAEQSGDWWRPTGNSSATWRKSARNPPADASYEKQIRQPHSAAEPPEPLSPKIHQQQTCSRAFLPGWSRQAIKVIKEINHPSRHHWHSWQNLSAPVGHLSALCVCMCR